MDIEEYKEALLEALKNCQDPDLILLVYSLVLGAAVS